MAIRMLVTLVVQMDDEQEAAYVADHSKWSDCDVMPTPRRKDLVEDVRDYLLTVVRESPAFGHHSHDTEPGAAVTLKER